jgi:hypothetical protein
MHLKKPHYQVIQRSKKFFWNIYLNPSYIDHLESKKTKPSLTINITQPAPSVQSKEQPPATRSDQFISSANHSSKPTVAQLSEMVQMLDITTTQKDKLEEFLKCREKIGDLTNDDLSVEGELGSGNGGVVLKVRHRKFGTAMAKKVSIWKRKQNS